MRTLQEPLELRTTRTFRTPRKSGMAWTPHAEDRARLESAREHREHAWEHRDMPRELPEEPRASHTQDRARRVLPRAARKTGRKRVETGRARVGMRRARPGTLRDDPERSGIDGEQLGDVLWRRGRACVVQAFRPAACRLGSVRLRPDATYYAGARNLSALRF